MRFEKCALVEVLPDLKTGIESKAKEHINKYLTSFSVLKKKERPAPVLQEIFPNARPFRELRDHFNFHTDCVFV